MNTFFPANRANWVSRPKSTLRAYGKAEHIRRLTELIEYGYFDENYVHEAIVRDYSIYARISEPYYTIHPESGENEINVDIFTIVAFPRPMAPPEYMKTFAIREDGILREYKPGLPGAMAWGVFLDLGARTWEPVR